METAYRRYHYVLEPESSVESDGTEKTDSVYSMQDKETEYVRDESDTCTKSEDSEYTVNSLPTVDNCLVESASSDSTAYIIRTENIVVEVREHVSSGSSEREIESLSGSEDSELGQADYWHCAQCKKTTNHPKYRYCMKCFRLRKEMFPPKPRGTKKRVADTEGAGKRFVQAAKKRKHSSSEPETQDPLDMDNPLKLKTLDVTNRESFSSLCNKVEAIQASKRLKAGDDAILADVNTSKRLKADDDAPSIAADVNINSLTCRSLIGKFGTLNTSSQYFNSLCVSMDKVDEDNLKNTLSSVTSSDVSSMSRSDGVSDALQDDGCDTSALCIMCVRAPKNGAFVHVKDVHSCCCYSCALKVWRTTKKCPTCNYPASRVARLVVS